MKVPFRQQATDYDCVPTTFINALNYLFSRSEIPPFIVQRVYKECLDGEGSRGTTSRAIRDLGYLLSKYKDKRHAKFAIETQYLCGKQVHLGQNSRIMQCIKENGIALLNVHSSWSSWHYILGFHIEDGWFHCYDPNPRTKRFTKFEAIQFDWSARQQEANLRIRCEWLDKRKKNLKHPEDRKYVFGYTEDRECLLMKRIYL